MNRKRTQKRQTVAPELVPERDDIMDFLSAANKPRSFKRIAGHFAVVDDAAQFALERRLKAMQRDGQIIKNRREGYGLVKKMDILPGRVIAHPDGYGFMRPDEGGDDLYLSAKEMRSVLHDDRILARVIGIDRRGRKEGALVEVLERANQQVVGRYIREGSVGVVVPDNKRINQDILIARVDSRKAKSGQYVVARIVQQPDRHTQPIGEIVEVLGTHMSGDLAIDIAIRSHEIPAEWPAILGRETEKIAAEVREKDKHHREDLRGLPLVTIDGEEAMDFDDAVYCEKKGKGWRLLVAIADVSHYVRQGSALDDVAQERGNSVYFPRRVIPMLPEVLSNGLCSLNPEVDRLCMVCELNITKNGRVKNFRFFEGVMRSAARMTYDNVARIAVERDSAIRKQNRSVSGPIDNLYQLYKIMHSYRKSRAVIDFDTGESRLIFNGRGQVVDIESALRNDAHRLIEEFMLAANVAAAEYLLENEIPALFRVHDTPKEEKLNDLRAFLAELGLSLGGDDEPTTADYARLLDHVRDREDRHLIETVLLRSMPLAVYSADNSGHFGLGFPAYAHFTSPIRRYPDLLVHRAIRYLLRRGSQQGFHYSKADMNKYGTHCSMTERRADEATREVMQWYKCRFMQDKVGEEFPGIISSVTAFGVFVELADIYVEGLVHITSLPID
ncbi:MAG TPA: ribonuclease R, partial [Gammaproteobacteria bacterium]|nr:ribonuclease R [Gammaproteobacteria bacterium]